MVSLHRKEYLRNYQREWVARRRAQFFEGKSCAQCGSTYKLELDHTDPSEKEDHKIWSWSEARRIAELAKCQVLCEECHKKKTKVEHAETFRKVGPEGTKWCSCCFQFLPVEQFVKNRTTWTGLANDCKACSAIPERRNRGGKRRALEIA